MRDFAIYKTKRNENLEFIEIITAENNDKAVVEFSNSDYFIRHNKDNLYAVIELKDMILFRIKFTPK